jgi:hypothetical protein
MKVAGKSGRRTTAETGQAEEAKPVIGIILCEGAIEIARNIPI